MSTENHTATGASDAAIPSPEGLGLGASPVGPLTMTFKIEGGGKVVEGTMKCTDNDGTVHLPMMVDSALKQVANSVPQICSATTITIIASIDWPNGSDDRQLPGHTAQSQNQTPTG